MKSVFPQDGLTEHRRFYAAWGRVKINKYIKGSAITAIYEKVLGYTALVKAIL